MNKFVIKKKISHNNNTTTTTNETTSSTVQNLKENVTYTKEQNQLYNHIYSIVGNSGSIILSDKVGEVEQLLYLLYDLEGEDKFLDFIFHDPTETYLNRVRSLLPPMDDETRELVRKHLHNYAYDHLLTYDYKKLDSLKSIH